MKLRVIGLPVPSGNWEECEICAAQSGSPRLCDECLKKRSLCHSLQDYLQKQQDLFLKHGKPPVEHRIGVKALIVASNWTQVLMVKRRMDDPHKPGFWEIPGGRIERHEQPLDGLFREVKEEVNLEINKQKAVPIDVHHFTRDDGQLITMLVYACKDTSGSIKLSEEHTEWCWTDIKDERLGGVWESTINNYKLMSKNFAVYC